MALKNTVPQLKALLAEITHDLEKSDRGNKAASQRVRTGTIKLEKVAKLYRKESVKAEKENKGSKKAAPKGKTAKAPAKKAAPKAAPKGKTAKKATKSHAMSFQRKRSAKLPARGASASR